MSVLRPRNRLVYFRVSEDEFQQFNQICESMGARSISDLARSAMRRMIEQAGHNGDHDSTDVSEVSAKLSVLETSMCDLNRKVQHLAMLLGGEDHAKIKAEEQLDSIESNA